MIWHLLRGHRVGRMTPLTREWSGLKFKCHNCRIGIKGWLK